jgi:predicted NBD/HSP70 family sugar kinase/DNA-binding XRE family transcriptional regulator
MVVALNPTMRTLTGDQSFLKKHNKAALVRLVRSQPGLSRSELARLAGITKSTVGLLVQELIDDGWLTDGAVAASSVGRPSIPLYPNLERLMVMGLELGVASLNAVVTGLDGQVLAQERQDCEHSTPETAIEALACLAETLLGQSKLGQRRLLALGVSLPGPVYDQGMLLNAPNIGWEQVPFAYLIKRRLGQASQLTSRMTNPLVFVDNDANLAAMSEYVFGEGQPPGHSVYLYLGVGVGGGLVLDGRLYRGAQGFAGEVGHTVLLPSGPRCRCGNQGCAETLIGQRALSQLIAPDGPLLAIEEIRARLERHEAQTMRAVRTVAQYLGLLIGNLINTLNPASVIIGGPMAFLGDLLVEQAAIEARKRVFFKPQREVAIQLCKYRLDACAVGAAGYALHTVLEDAEQF